MEPRRRETEAQIHRAVADFLTRALPQGAWFTTIGHGGGGKVRGAHLKARGVKAGVPDILVVYNGAAWFIELKGPKGRRSPEQVNADADIQDAGGRVAMCRSVDEVERFLRHYVCIPLRASVAA